MDRFQYEMKEEKDTLKKVYQAAKSYKKELSLMIEKLRDEFERIHGDYERLPDISYMRNKITGIRNDIIEIEDSMRSLYFGRVDFRCQDEPVARKYYISQIPSSARNACESSGINIVDWRAPISSLYYSRNNWYEAPQGVMNGELHLVRHLELQHDQLLKLTDLFFQSELSNKNDSIISDQRKRIDPVLAKYLSRSGAERYKNIVQTIQAEQNAIIRYPFDRHLVIQGAAGTGKTIVLLYRVAYCIYETQCKPEEILVLTPHDLLLKQIQGILPELYIHNVEQLTLKEFFWKLVGRSKSRNIEVKPVDVWIEFDQILNQQIKHKHDHAMLELLDRILDHAWKDMVNNLPDLKYYGRSLVQQQKIKELIALATTNESYSVWYIHFQKQLQETIYAKIKGMDDHGKISESLAKSYIRKYMSKQKLFWQYVVPRYKDFGTNKVEFLPEWTIDDLGALLYLYIKINGVNKRYAYIFVDEAQNLSPVWLQVLNMCLLPHGSLTLSGDLCQLATSIYGNFVNMSWKQMCNILDSDVSIASLNYSYRSTKAIIDKARWALEKVLPEWAEKLQGMRSSASKIENVMSIGEFFNFVGTAPNISTIAIICPTQEYVQKVKQELKGDASINREISVISVDEAGGLEFDAVLVNGLNLYNRANPSHARALYTAISRAVHYLFFCIK